MHPLSSLVDAAWHEVMFDPERCGELGRQLARRGRDEGDAYAEAHGELHCAFHLVRVASLEQASAAVARALVRCGELGIQSAVWLCDDLRGFLAVRRGDIGAALDIGRRNEAIAPRSRAPRERAITLLLLHTACHQSLRFDAALRYGYKHLALAEAIDDLGQQAMALNNLSAVHLNTFNVEDALPLQEQAHAIWTTQRTRARLGLSVNNMIAICDALQRHGQAYAALQTWLGQPGGVSAEDLKHYNSRIALALLGVGRDAEAEHHLASGPYRSPVNPRTEVWWTWTRARLLNRQRRHEEARTLCQIYLDTRVSRPVADAPYDLVQLHDAVRVASEALNDQPRARGAARRAHAACLPLVSSSVQARYLAMLLPRHPDLEPTAANTHGRRLQALEREVHAYERALEQPPESGPISTGASVKTPVTAPSSASASTAVSPPDTLGRHPFLAHVSHEMREPLHGMLGMTSLLLLSDLDARQRRLATLAHDSAGVLLGLVNDILDLARMESGQFVLDPQPFVLAPMVIETVERFRAETDRKRLRLTLALDPALPPRVRGDAQRLRQVLTHLIGNAVKFTTQGEVAISVTPVVDGARFVVRDTGKGMSEALQAALFAEFAPVRSASDHDGIGVGLAVSRQLVRLMRGEIGLSSRPRHGSLLWFEVMLPAA